MHAAILVKHVNFYRFAVFFQPNALGNVKDHGRLFMTTRINGSDQEFADIQARWLQEIAILDFLNSTSASSVVGFI